MNIIAVFVLAVASASSIGTSASADPIRSEMPAGAATTATPHFGPAPNSFVGEETIGIGDATKGAAIYYTTDGSTPTAQSTPFTVPFKIFATTTVKAIAIASGDAPSAVAGGVYTLESVTAAPTFNIASRSFSGTLWIGLHDVSQGSTIFYTTDGSTPTANSTRFTGSFRIATTTTVKAIAIVPGFTPSPIVTATYSVYAQSPGISPPPDSTYPAPQTVTLTDLTPGAVIYYTTDGSVPTTASTPYTAPFQVGSTAGNSTVIVRAFAVAPNYAPSEAIVSFYTISITEPTPAFSPAPGNYAGAQSVSISDADPKATIYYTNDGSVPTALSTPYAGPFTVAGSERLNAIAVRSGFTSSAVTGTAYSIIPAGIVETVLHSFEGDSGNYLGDGFEPQAGLLQAKDGNFYGTTSMGGVSIEDSPAYGTVFKITPAGVESVLYTLGSQNAADDCKYALWAPLDGSDPLAALIQGQDGDLYGTTSDIAGGLGLGAVIKITLTGQESTFWCFGLGGGSPLGDGAQPLAALIQAKDGTFYGTTAEGGLNNLGTVVSLTPAGKETLLHSFGEYGTEDGTAPSAALTEGVDGNFYGTTRSGGTYNLGAVFRITPSGTEEVLYSFNGCDFGDCGVTGSKDGVMPLAPLTLASDGSFYGTTVGGGAFGSGTVFKISPAGHESVLYSFSGPTCPLYACGEQGHSTDGASPAAGVIVGSDGNLYGTTTLGGTFFDGTVFRLTPDGTETVLWAFSGCNPSCIAPGNPDGIGPIGLIQGKDGNFYGTTTFGGANATSTIQYQYGGGTVFRLTGVIGAR
jgi:uncharacterized repeat protein (TIGR03803 family)